MGTPIISRHMANNRRRTRGTRDTSTRGRGSDRGAQIASSSTRAIPQVLHDDDDDFMPARSQRYQRSSEDPVDHDPADDEPDPHVFDEFENIDGIYPWGRIPPIINPITPMEMQELNRMFPFQPFD